MSLHSYFNIYELILSFVLKLIKSVINPRSNLYLKTKDLSEENICYKRTDDIICCYVKITKNTTGGSKYYKFTNNKVEFQYNNNEYILLSKIKTYLKKSY